MHLAEKICATMAIVGVCCFFAAMLVTKALGDDWRKYAFLAYVGFGGLTLSVGSAIAWLLAKVWST